MSRSSLALKEVGLSGTPYLVSPMWKSDLPTEQLLNPPEDKIWSITILHTPSQKRCSANSEWVGRGGLQGELPEGGKTASEAEETKSLKSRWIAHRCHCKKVEVIQKEMVVVQKELKVRCTHRWGVLQQLIFGEPRMEAITTDPGRIAGRG